MTNRLITISFTGLNAGGGVPKFNRDLHTAFPDRECVHFCAANLPSNEHRRWEWEQARALNLHLIATKQLRQDDVIVADGFWAAGLENFPYAISHSHGIWGHITHDDVKLGKEPENPFHHVAQVSFRRNWTRLERPLTAVSRFIADQMYLQWGFQTSRVINNGVDTEVFKPAKRKLKRRNPVAIHGVNDRANSNKGWDHIQEVISYCPGLDVYSLDEYAEFQGLSKPEALAQADVVIHPSGYEGNSMFVAEALACGVPIVAYDVGFLWKTNEDNVIGRVLDRRFRSPKMTASAVKQVIYDWDPDKRIVAERSAWALAWFELNIEKFRNSWRGFVSEIEDS